MSRKICGICALLVLLMAANGLAQQPTEIWYETTDLGAGRWQYTYDVYNNSLAEGIDEFTIWFGIGSYDNLAIETIDPPDDQWDEIVWQPEPFLGDDGGYDAWADLATPIGVDQNVSGFAVSFDWLGIGEPGPQFYEIVVPGTVPVEVIDSGWTVPEPITALYLTIGGGFLLRNRVRKITKE